MKIEDIENAALDCALFEDYYYNPDLQPAYIDGFTRGANWRIDSVWHEASEEPERNRISRGTLGKSKGWNNKMFVRAEACKHQIRITNVRAERLQDISDEDCLKEGIIKGKVGSEDTHFMDAYYIPTLKKDPFCTPQGACSYLIDKISGKGTWENNPYVFVYDFELVK